MSAERGVQRFRVGEVPPLAEGYTDRPDTARGILEALVPGATLALVPGSAFAEGPFNWLRACGHTPNAGRAGPPGQLACHHRPAVDDRAGRFAGPDGPRRALAGGAIGTGADHQHAG